MTFLFIQFLPTDSREEPYIGSNYLNAHRVEMQREEYLSLQMKNHQTKVNVADSVNFADSGELRFLKDYYYYDTPGDLEITFVPYEEWLNEYSTVCD